MVDVCITYEYETEESAQDGDVADHGWIHPDTEAKRSLRKGGRRMYERNVRMSQRGAFMWPSLRAALAYLESNAGGPATEAHVSRGGGVSVRYLQDGAESDERENLELHVKCSAGSAARIARLLGVRLYRAPAPIR